MYGATLIGREDRIIRNRFPLPVASSSGQDRVDGLRKNEHRPPPDDGAGAHLVSYAGGDVSK